MNISFNRLDLRTQLLKGASPLAGETPATAIAGLACSAAIGFFESQVSQMARAPIHL